jgi:hypothetical protein
MLVLQKWSKGKQKEKVNNAVLFDQATYDKLLSEVPKYKQITPSVLSERLRVITRSRSVLLVSKVETLCIAAPMIKIKLLSVDYLECHHTW